MLGLLVFPNNDYSAGFELQPPCSESKNVANKEAEMSVLDALNLIASNPTLNNNSIKIRRRKPIANIEEHIRLAANID